MFKKFLFVLVCLLFTVCKLYASNYTSYLFIDSSSSLQFDEVLNKNFKALDRGYVFNSFTTSTYWVKLKANGTFANNRSLVLSNSYNHYESIYLVYQNDSIKTYTIGSNQVFQSPTYVPSFDLNEVKTVIISIKSNTFLYESFQVSDSAKTIRYISYFLIFQILIISYLIISFIYLLILYVKSRSKLLGNYILYLLSVILLFFFISNLGRFIFWEKLPFSMSYIEGYIIFFMIWTYLLFAIKFTKIKEHHKFIYLIVKAFLIVLSIHVFVITFFLPTSEFNLLGNIYAFISLVILLVVAVVSYNHYDKYSKVYLIGVLALIFGMSVRVLMDSGFISYSLITDSFVYIGQLIEIILFTFIVIKKIEEEAKLKKETIQKIKTGETKIKELKTEVEKIKELSKQAQRDNKIVDFETINSKLIDPLTNREIEVLKELINKGTQQEIADRLFISKNTLKTHISNLYVKFDVKNRIELIDKIGKL